MIEPLVKALLSLMLFGFSILAFGQEAAVPESAGQWQAFLASIGGAQGAGLMGSIVLAIQVLLFILKSPMGYLAGPYKLLLVTGLTLFLGVTSLKIQGFDWQSALMHATTLASFQVFLNQIWKNLKEAKNPTVKPVPTVLQG